MREKREFCVHCNRDTKFVLVGGVWICSECGEDAL